ncbi:unnamed protein product, partial [Owenia fusiformis]
DFKTLAIVMTGMTVFLGLGIAVVGGVIKRRFRNIHGTSRDHNVESSNPFSADSSGGSTVMSGSSTYYHRYDEIDESRMLPQTNNTYSYVETIPLRVMYQEDTGD